MRDHAPYGALPVQETVYERLEHLQEEGTIAGVTTAAWGGLIETVPIAATEGFVPPARARVDEFETWAARHGVTLKPAFETREIGLLTADETREAIVPPVVCLAVYQGDELKRVFPHADGEAVHTVHDGLDRLETDADQFTTDEPELAVR